MPPSILWMAPALSGGGYASEALAFAQGLVPQLKSNFKLRQFAEQPDQNFFSGMPRSILAKVMTNIEFPNADRVGKKVVVVCHSPPDAWKPSKFQGWDQLSPCPPPGTKFSIGRTMYETDSVPEDWVRRCNRMKSVWVPTEFHRQTFLRAGVQAHKLVVVGEPVDSDFFDPAKVSTPFSLPPPVPSAAAAGASFRFLSVFKWEKRKGWDALLAAYFAEFKPSDPVELLLKTRAFHSSDDFDALISSFVQEHGLPKTSAGRATVRILGDDLSLEELRSLYAAADCFVLPSRGEGWGRPHVEAMSMGLPVIATNWSGPTAFLDEAVGYPLGYSVEPVAPELNLPGHNWAEPSVAHLRQLMRQVYEHREEAKERGGAARQRMVSEYSPDALAKRVVEAVAESKRRISEHRQRKDAIRDEL